MSGLTSIESDTDMKKLLISSRLITHAKISVAVRTLFQRRTESFLDVNITSVPGHLFVPYQVFVRLNDLLTILNCGSMILYSLCTPGVDK